MKKNNGIWIVVLSLLLMLGMTVLAAETPVESAAKEHHGQRLTGATAERPGLITGSSSARVRTCGRASRVTH